MEVRNKMLRISSCFEEAGILLDPFVKTSAIVLIVIANVYAQDDSKPVESFSYLETIRSSGTVHFNPAVTEIIDKQLEDLPRDHPLFWTLKRWNFEGSIILQTRLSPESDEQFYVIHDWGPSTDPGFTIFRNLEKPVMILSIGGVELYIPGNGFLYSVSGHYDNLFNHRRKFKYQSGRFVEVEQPFYYVGINTTTVAPVELLLAPQDSMQQIVASLPANYEVEVLLAKKEDDPNDERYFLVKTPLGLLGWVRITHQAYSGWPIEGIFMSGD
jgi:hypothetical protein